MGTRPKSAAEWRALLDEPSSILALTEREREAMITHHADWPDGVSNLRYMTQRAMAQKMGISLVTFLRHLHSASYKLGLHPIPPRTKIPPATRRAVLEAVGDGATCDLCQRPIVRAWPAADADGMVAYADLVALPRFTEPVSIDHIVPVSLGGTNEPSNLRVVHAFCNLSDGARVPAEDRAPAPFGYVRRSEVLPNGRGPRTWIEVDEKAAEIVRFAMSEYATGGHSIASLCRLLKRRARQFDRKTIARLVGGAPRMQAEEVLWLIENHARQSSERDMRAGYVPLVPAETAAACSDRLAIRYDRIKRARETRERHLLERTEGRAKQSSRERLAAPMAATARRQHGKSRVP